MRRGVRNAKNANAAAITTGEKKSSAWRKEANARGGGEVCNYLERELDVEGTRAPMWKVKMPPH